MFESVSEISEEQREVIFGPEYMHGDFSTLPTKLHTYYVM